LGTRLTESFWLTNTRTLSHLKSVVTDEPSSTVKAFTLGFSFMMICVAVSPLMPTNSGHELLPTFNSIFPSQHYIKTLFIIPFFFSLKYLMVILICTVTHIKVCAYYLCKNLTSSPFFWLSSVMILRCGEAKWYL